MSNPGDEDATPVTGVRQLADTLAAGCKPRDAWRIGTEHEKFGFSRRDLSPVPYEPAGIRAVLEGLAPLGWKRIEDGGRLIGLSQEGRSISLEPGGQLELSGAPVRTLHETRDEMAAHFGELREACDPMFVGFAPLGFHPTATREQIGFMPKSRYGIMKRYMPLVGSMGLDMMLRTCTVQVNLDFSSEADMVRKMRVSSLLQPMATALFANSPFLEGRASGFLSTRAHVWTDVDNARAGVPGVVFEDGFGFEAYVEWMLDVPMYFVARSGVLRDVAGASFRRWLQGREDRLAGLEPTVGDFADHLTTVFPDVRLKRFLEMRGADAGSPAMMLAQSALWVGLLYDSAALDEAEALVGRFSVGELLGLRGVVPREGLAARVGAGSLLELAGEAVGIARAGLVGRGLGEEGLLAPLEEIVAGGPVQAERWLERVERVWRGDVGRVLVEAAV
jgi:glutamate--cysteine ligase